MDVFLKENILRGIGVKKKKMTRYSAKIKDKPCFLFSVTFFFLSDPTRVACRSHISNHRKLQLSKCSFHMGSNKNFRRLQIDPQAGKELEVPWKGHLSVTPGWLPWSFLPPQISTRCFIIETPPIKSTRSVCEPWVLSASELSGLPTSGVRTSLPFELLSLVDEGEDDAIYFCSGLRQTTFFSS